MSQQGGGGAATEFRVFAKGGRQQMPGTDAGSVDGCVVGGGQHDVAQVAAGQFDRRGQMVQIDRVVLIEIAYPAEQLRQEGPSYKEMSVK